MSQDKHRPHTAVSAEPGPSSRGDIEAIYALAQGSPHVFASPIGPVAFEKGSIYLPRFVFFGPNASDDSWRLALMAGLDHRDARASRALVALAARLAFDSETGHGLNLSFFPLVDVGWESGSVTKRELARERWDSPSSPEIEQLAGDARMRGYHGFVHLETDACDDGKISVRVRGAFSDSVSPELALVTAEEARPFPVRVEAESGTPHEGPLTLSADLPVAAFELTIRIPGSWSDETYQHAAVSLLERFLRRHRAFQAYGQHL